MDLYQLFISYVDFTHRLYDIVNSLPYISKKRPLMKQMGEMHERVNEARNYYQHMRGDLSEGKAMDFPILGGVSWVHNEFNYVTIPNHTSANCSVMGIPWDRQENRWACKYQLTVKGKIIHIDTLHAFSRELFTWVHGGIRFSTPQTLGWGNTTSMRAAVVRGPLAQMDDPRTQNRTQG